MNRFKLFKKKEINNIRVIMLSISVICCASYKCNLAYENVEDSIIEYMYTFLHFQVLNFDSFSWTTSSSKVYLSPSSLPLKIPACKGHSLVISSHIFIPQTF